jgi:hypothetical protein
MGLGGGGGITTSNLKVKLSMSKSESAPKTFNNLHCGGQYTLELSGPLRPLAALPNFANFGVEVFCFEKQIIYRLQ